VIQRFEAQAGAVQMRVLRTLVGRHLRKSMGELYHSALSAVHAVSHEFSHAARACAGFMREAALRSELLASFFSSFPCFEPAGILAHDTGTSLGTVREDSTIFCKCRR
jgi:hypothetical protein